MASADFFVQKLKEATDEQRYSYNSAYVNGTVSIRNKNTDANEYYTIYREGLVIKNPSCERMKTYDIPTGDYEIYSPVQIIKSGYLKFKDSDTMIKEMTSLYNIVSEIENADIPKKEKFFTCGSAIFYGGCLQGGFSFYHCNGIEVKLKSIENFMKLNSQRTKEGRKVIPFDSTIDEHSPVMKLFLVVDVDYQKEIASVENQLDCIDFILDRVDAEFVDDYIRRWIY